MTAEGGRQGGAPVGAAPTCMEEAWEWCSARLLPAGSLQAAGRPEGLRGASATADAAWQPLWPWRSGCKCERRRVNVSVSCSRHEICWPSRACQAAAQSWFVGSCRSSAEVFSPDTEVFVTAALVHGICSCTKCAHGIIAVHYDCASQVDGGNVLEFASKMAAQLGCKWAWGRSA